MNKKKCKRCNILRPIDKFIFHITRRYKRKDGSIKEYGYQESKCNYCRAAEAKKYSPRKLKAGYNYSCDFIFSDHLSQWH